MVDRLLTNPTTCAIVPELVPLANALKSTKRANSGLTWIRQKHVTPFHLGERRDLHSTRGPNPKSWTRRKSKPSCVGWT